MNWEGLGYAILIVLGLIVGGVGLISLILKLIHMGTGWGFFGFLCILVDLAIVVFGVLSLIDGGASDLSGFITLIILSLFGLLSMISNISSLGSR